MPRPSRYPIDQSPFFRLQRKKRLAELLSVSTRELRALGKSQALYREWDEPKKNGKGIRHIENPRRDLKHVQARIARLLSRIEPPDFLFCPVKGRSYVDNAARHRDQRVVRCLDIKSYFQASTARRVNWFFREVMQCSTDVAHILTRLATFNGHLPTGSPLSPIMAFYAHWDMWHAVHAVTAAHGLRLSVYIDDLTLSGGRVPDRVVWTIKKIIYRAGLEYHKEKHFIDRPAEITGVIVNGGQTMLPHRGHLKRKEARREFEYARGLGDRWLLKQAQGRLAGLDGQLKQIAATKRDA